LQREAERCADAVQAQQNLELAVVEAFHEAVDRNRADVLLFLVGTKLISGAHLVAGAIRAAEGGRCDSLDALVACGVLEEPGGFGALCRAFDCDRGSAAALLLDYAGDLGATEANQTIQQCYAQRIERLRLWQRVAHRAPPDGLMMASPHKLRLTLFDDIAAWLEDEGVETREGNRYAFHAARLFSNAPNVLRYLATHGHVGRQPLHDLLQDIRTPELWFALTPHERGLWEGAVLRFGPAMGRLVKFAELLNVPKASVEETRRAVACDAYVHGEANPALAALCLEVGYTQAEFDEALALAQRFVPHVKALPAMTLPGELFGKPGYVWRDLPAGDLRGLLLGEYVGCCQHVAGEGATATEHGFLEEDGGFYVLCASDKEGGAKMIAETWAWRGEDGELTLDSLEPLGAHMDAAAWRALLDAMAARIDATNAGSPDPVTRLMIGMGGRTPALGAPDPTPAVPRTWGGYWGDAVQQVCWRDFTAPAPPRPDSRDGFCFPFTETSP
jgi:hypothetical protein